jgi:hypothetical protein
MHRSAALPRSSFAFPLQSRFHILSCEVRPIGRGLTFVPSNVATRIRTITIRRSLLPKSQTRIAKDQPCGLPSPRGAIRGFHVPTVQVRQRRCLLSTGRVVGHESILTNCSSHLHYLLVQACQPFALVGVNGLYRRFTSVHHTDYLALIRLVAARRVRLLRLAPRACGALLHCRGRSLFRPLDSPSDTGGSLRCRENNLNSDIVSHRK